MINNSDKQSVPGPYYGSLVVTDYIQYFQSRIKKNVALRWIHTESKQMRNVYGITFECCHLWELMNADETSYRKRWNFDSFVRPTL